MGYKWKRDKSYGHVFSPFEVFNLLKKHQFKIIKTIYVNYNTGNYLKTFLMDKFSSLHKRKIEF